MPEADIGKHQQLSRIVAKLREVGKPIYGRSVI